MSTHNIKKPVKWKKNDMSLSQSSIIEHKAFKELDEINRLVDWNDLFSLLKKINFQRLGLGYHPLMMFKYLLIQSWYNLSYPQLENSLR